MSAGCPLEPLMAPSFQRRMVWVENFSCLARHVVVIHVLRLTGCSWFVQGRKTEMSRLLLNHVAVAILLINTNTKEFEDL